LRKRIGVERRTNPFQAFTRILVHTDKAVCAATGNESQLGTIRRPLYIACCTPHSKKLFARSLSSKWRAPHIPPSEISDCFIGRMKNRKISYTDLIEFIVRQ